MPSSHRGRPGKPAPIPSAMANSDAQCAADGWTAGDKTSGTGGKGWEDHGRPGKPAPIPSAMANFDAQCAADGWTAGDKTSWTGGKVGSTCFAA